MNRALLTAALLFALGCAEDFLPASYVDDLRPVAALVEVEGEPSRPNPYPGDVITVTQHVIDAGPKPKIEWRFVACVPIVSVFTPPPCARLIEPCDGCVNDEDPLPQDPIARFQVPSEEELGDADQVVLQGAICAGDLASEDRLIELLLRGAEDTNPCANPKTDEGRLVSVRIPIEQYEPPNHQPEIQSVQIDDGQGGYTEDFWLDLRPWAPRVGCCTDEAKKDNKCISRTTWENGIASIQLSVTPESLEPFQIEEDGETIELQEEIQISWLADAGGFERSFSFIDESSEKDDDNPFESVEWGVPSYPHLEGSYVRFNFVIRDGRGGTAWEERGLCLVP